MSNRLSFGVRALLGATLLGSLLAPPARAAAIKLLAADDGNYRCMVRVADTNGVEFASDVRPVTGSTQALIPIGAFPPSAIGGASNFESLELRCWRRHHPTQANPLGLDPQAYSITLHRSDSFWMTTDAATGLPRRNLPHDGAVVSLSLATTQHPTAIQIVRAWAVPDLHGQLELQEYDQLDFHHRLSAD